MLKFDETLGTPFYNQQDKCLLQGNDDIGTSVDLPDHSGNQYFKVHIWDASDTPAMNHFLDIFFEQLEHHRIKAVKITADDLATNETLTKDIFLILKDEERLQSCVDYVLKKQKKDQKRELFLIVVHFKESRCLPNYGSKYKLDYSKHTAFSIIETLDFAFTKNKKIYNCKINRDAWSVIDNFVTKREKDGDNRSD